MTTKKLAKDIYEAVGGSSNINSLYDTTETPFDK